MQPLSSQSAQQPQQRQRQDSRSAAVVDRSALSKVLDGPVDISDLWASRASLTEQHSQGELSGDTGLVIGVELCFRAIDVNCDVSELLHVHIGIRKAEVTHGRGEPARS
jgi:hypothetical protein